MCGTKNANDRQIPTVKITHARNEYNKILVVVHEVIPKIFLQ